MEKWCIPVTQQVLPESRVVIFLCSPRVIVWLARSQFKHLHKDSTPYWKMFKKIWDRVAIKGIPVWTHVLNAVKHWGILKLLVIPSLYVDFSLSVPLPSLHMRYTWMPSWWKEQQNTDVSISGLVRSEIPLFHFHLRIQSLVKFSDILNWLLNAAARISERIKFLFLQQAKSPCSNTKVLGFASARSVDETMLVGDRPNGFEGSGNQCWIDVFAV